MSIEEQRSEAFKVAFVAKFGFGPMTAAANADAHAIYHAAEWAWNAALDSVAIELPKLPGEMNSLSPWVKGHEAARRSDRQAI